jgi:hypothetical protein
MIQYLTNLFKAKQKRELPLIFVYEFKTGEKIYTYRPEDFGKISSRYYRNVQEASNYLQTFAMTKNEWEKAVEGCKELIQAALTLGKTNDHIKALMDVNSTFDWFLSKASGIKGANETILEMLYCAFYVLDEERETGYNEACNKKKLDLLNNEPEMRDFFLSSLLEKMNNLQPISRDDTLRLILELERMAERLTYLNMPEGLTK